MQLLAHSDMESLPCSCKVDAVQTLLLNPYLAIAKQMYRHVSQLFAHPLFWSIIALHVPKKVHRHTCTRATSSSLTHCTHTHSRANCVCLNFDGASSHEHTDHIRPATVFQHRFKVSVLSRELSFDTWSLLMLQVGLLKQEIT